MHGDTLIPVLAIGTIVVATAIAVWQRTRVAAHKHDPKRSAIISGHGEGAASESARHRAHLIAETPPIRTAAGCRRSAGHSAAAGHP